MSDRMALKRLTGSDLTFFDYHFQHKTHGDSRQKAINLNVNVFLSEIYPALKTMPNGRFNVLTTVYGPGILGAFTPSPSTRPILNNNGKNWRLNGATMPDDPENPDRFRNVTPGDLALLRFRGDPVPTEADIVLVTVHEDPHAHDALQRLVPGTDRNSMAATTVAEIERALDGIALPEAHPLRNLEPDDEEQAAIEEVAFGGDASPALRRRTQRVTPEQLEKARAEASRIGAAGEAAVNSWLLAEQEAGRLRSLDWVARRDAAAPFDFTVEEAGVPTRIDAKSTGGAFERAFHVSIAEIHEAGRVDRAGPYKIARVYEMDDDGAKCRILDDFSAFARAILESLAQIPEWSKPDSFSIASSELPFGHEFDLSWPDPGEEEEA